MDDILSHAVRITFGDVTLLEELDDILFEDDCIISTTHETTNTVLFNEGRIFTNTHCSVSVTQDIVIMEDYVKPSSLHDILTFQEERERIHFVSFKKCPTLWSQTQVENISGLCTSQLFFNGLIQAVHVDAYRHHPDVDKIRLSGVNNLKDLEIKIDRIVLSKYTKEPMYTPRPLPFYTAPTRKSRMTLLRRHMKCAVPSPRQTLAERYTSIRQGLTCELL